MAWKLARRQHGVLTRRDLLALGFGEEAIRHRLATGRLHKIYTGVYAVGRRELTREGRWMAAVLACGTDAVLSHGSAAALWGIGQEWHLIEVSVRHRGWPRRRGLKVRSRPALPEQDITARRGIPVTTVARTILDQAATPISDGSLERLVNEADVARDIDLDLPALRRYCDRRRGEPGVRRLRRLLDPETFRLSDSELERLFRPLAIAAGLPQPLTRVIVNGYKVDFYWPELALVVETDSLRYHRSAIKQTRDLVRDQVHTAAGLTTLRFTHWQVAHEPGHVEAILAATRVCGR
ncbi:MAG TPA: type IV toxin-antitoxin system AbiEi family antitoxin domain-containing protein [Solirubrobacterales bacterium]|nr:type IV toxin-antitoxin system AbiEi family antitoxin domain-containing protein [Solirubrobacterales bacterium]